MNFVADEGVDQQIVDQLRQEGHAVWYVREMEPGIDDDLVLARSSQHQALLMTADKDFGELIYRLKRVSAGVILIRLAGVSPEGKAEIVVAAARQHSSELKGAFSVISPGAVRVRRRR